MARAFDDASTQYLVRTSGVVTVVPITMACWAYSDDLTIEQVLMGLSGVGSATESFRLILRGATGGDPLAAATSNTMASSATAYPTNRWFHAAGTWIANNSRKVYLEGVEATNTQTAAVPTIDRTSIGARVQSSITHHLSGRVAEAAIWNVALLQAEITMLALGVSPIFVRPGNLVAYWPLWGTKDPEIDVRGGNHLTLTNGPTQIEHYSKIFYPANLELVKKFVAAAGPTIIVASDTIEAGLIDASDLRAILALSDSAPVGLSDAITQLRTFLEATDTISVHVTDVPAILAVLGLSDILEVHLDDQATISVVGGTTLINVSDTISVQVLDLLDTIQVALTLADTTPVVTDDQISQLFVTVAVAEVCQISVADAIAVLAQLSVAESLGVSVLDSGALAVLAILTAQDAVATGLDDQQSLVVRINTDDLGALGLTEFVQALARLDVQDPLPVVLDDAGQISWNIALGDTVAVALVEAAVVVVVQLHVLGPVLVATARSLLGAYGTQTLLDAYESIPLLGTYQTVLQ